MSLDYVKFTNGFEKFMPKEYRDMVEHGPFGKKVSVSQMGSFKEILEEHPMLSLIHISEPTRRTPISYAVFCLKLRLIVADQHQSG